MKQLYRSLFFLTICCAAAFDLSAQTGKYTIENAHAHNDYLHPTPFYSAFNTGFGSIEADVYPINNELFVAHGKSEIQKERTLKRLYLDAIKNELKKNPERQLNLLVDIKENYAEALKILIVQLKPLKKYLATQKSKGQLTVIISGSRPNPEAYADYPDYIFFDSDLSSAHTPEQWKRVGLVSLQFSKLSKWRGKEEISAKDAALLQKTIDSVHTSGKPIRFWAAPDNSVGWEELMKLRVDYIGTDKIKELALFLKQ